MGLYIEKHSDTIDRCRFCWMCRHVCTQGRVTSKETHTARALGLILASIRRAANEYDHDIAELLFQCCQCGYCKEWCVSKYDAPAFIRAGRADAVAAGYIPETVKNVAESLRIRNHPFGENAVIADSLNERLAALNKKCGKSGIVLYLGAFARYMRPEVACAAISLFKKFGLDFAVLEDEPDSGYFYYNFGFIEEAKAQSKKLMQAVKNASCKTLVVLSPSDYYAMAYENDGKLFSSEGITVTDVASYIGSLDDILDTRPVKKFKTAKVSYHDSSYLGRYLKIYDQPRWLLKRVLKENLHELRWNRNLAKSSGSSLLLTYPEMALEIASSMLDDVREEKVATLVVSGAESKESLLRALKKEDSIEIIEMVELLKKVL